MSGGDGIDSPQKVLFLQERLNLKWTQVHRIGAGLQNMGNTCFLNSALQCLTYTPPFTNYLLTREHSKTCKLLYHDASLEHRCYRVIVQSCIIVLHQSTSIFWSESCLTHQWFVHLSLLQVTSRGSVWCAPCKTTSFRFLQTLEMSLSPLVCWMSSKVSGYLLQHWNCATRLPESSDRRCCFPFLILEGKL